MTPLPSPLWFVDRSAGEVTLLLMSAVMILGIVRSGVPTAFPFLVEGAHINLALLAIAFAASTSWPRSLIRSLALARSTL